MAPITTNPPSMSGLGLVLAAGLALSSAACAQERLPEALVPASTLETFEAGSFLESIVAKRDGELIFVDHASHTIFARDTGGELTTLSQTDAELRGLALDLDDTLYATGRQANGVEAVFKVSADGALVPWVAAPEGRFLNGLTMVEPGVFLVADSFASLIWRVDVREQTIAPWFQHALTATNPDMPAIPGPNGVKVRDGAVYMSNSALAQVIRIPLRADGSAGAPEVFIPDLVIDDFAFSADGDFYGTTHIFNTVVVVRQDGSRAVIAGPEQGVTGSTSVVFGATPDDAQTLYVVGDGGVFLPPEDGIVPAELVALEVGEPGLSPIDSLSWVDRPQTVAGAPSFLVECVTAPGTDALRPLVGPSYLRYLELNADRIAFAGQLFTNPDPAPDASPDGRLYFTAVADADEARAFIQASPYYTAGLYARCDVHAFTALLGTLVGGVGWPAAATQQRP